MKVPNVDEADVVLALVLAVCAFMLTVALSSYGG